MEIQCHCPVCGALFRIARKDAGRKAKCPSCLTVSDMPADRVRATVSGGPDSLPLGHLRHRKRRRAVRLLAGAVGLAVLMVAAGTVATLVWLGGDRDARDNAVLLLVRPPQDRPEATAGPLDNWLQDLTAARRQAAREHKNILILFNGSAWSQRSLQLAREVFSQPVLRQKFQRDYVLVLVTFSRESVGLTRVQDPSANRRLLDEFSIRQLPTVVLADMQGRPYGFAGYPEAGADAFVRRLAQFEDFKRRRDRLFRQVDVLTGQQQLEAAQAALKLIKQAELQRFYAPMLRKWLDLAQQHDPHNEHGRQEVFFESHFFTHAYHVARSEPDQLAEVVVELDRWKKSHQFKDVNRAGRLHLASAHWLSEMDRHEEAARLAREGLRYRPQDELLRDQLARAVNSFPVRASGSGFAVSADGYLLTNYHVISGPGKTMVRLPQLTDPVPARVTAQDERRDIVLVKIDLPDNVTLRPMSLSAVELGRGARVAAFGFPLGDIVAKGLKLTTGVISATHQQTPDGLLLLDCRINPGNSGGPLCSSRGQVVGMVTAKSPGGFGVDSYGMALPSKDLLGFLLKHLPDYSPLGESPLAPATDDWVEVDRLVSPSVVMILKMR